MEGKETLAILSLLQCELPAQNLCWGLLCTPRPSTPPSWTTAISTVTPSQCLYPVYSVFQPVSLGVLLCMQSIVIFVSQKHSLLARWRKVRKVHRFSCAHATLKAIPLNKLLTFSFCHGALKEFDKWKHVDVLNCKEFNETIDGPAISVIYI